MGTTSDLPEARDRLIAAISSTRKQIEAIADGERRLSEMRLHLKYLCGREEMAAEIVLPEGMTVKEAMRDNHDNIREDVRALMNP